MKKINFIDLFAGCGGMSLGFMNAGFSGIFAIEKNKDAFTTLIHNLHKEKITNGYNWPKWLPLQNMTTADLLDNHLDGLKKMKQKVDLIIGGPPCQGFSLVGLRNPSDPRNRLTEEYIKIVEIIQPKIILLENVRGFQTAFKKNSESIQQPYSEYIIEQLENLPVGYKVFNKILIASEFGVPQPRPRFVLIAIRKDISDALNLSKLDNHEFYAKLLTYAKEFKEEHNLKIKTPLKDAIGDLETKNKKLKTCSDGNGFMQLSYKLPKTVNSYLHLMRKDCNSILEPNSLRLPNHRPETIKKFSFLLDKAEKGKTLSKEMRSILNIKKQCLTVLASNGLSTTTTTSPDDCIHYSEPRVLTVRENARIQSFPDWFEFQGKYTTGGLRRQEDCPRYSQVGNAVPPIMAEVMGIFIKDILSGVKI